MSADGIPLSRVAIGLPLGGLSRSEKTRRVRLVHGDAVVWGGSSRMAFYGIDTLRAGEHSLTGAVRYNLTFRKAR